MPKKGEKARKLAALSRGKGVRPPKVWFKKVQQSVFREYPKFGVGRRNLIVGGIWARMSTENKKKIVRKYQK